MTTANLLIAVFAVGCISYGIWKMDGGNEQ
jgi:hypothetical protein